ncbi:DUF2339 domain-containing protein [Microvirga pudoricolor]|uniref:DUF2339 domain-containing protein n=1 Tax=Microvirga pudoricolor TaxID=2778729 RepID=UPI001952263B|nr:DUF2339 domain-containing protein [Microvirga pudoricolor]MBM6594593.1 DUF2339 domain-containing protein [Microvirga pudoricolor]
MDDDLLITILILLALAFPVCAIAAFVLSLSSRRAVLALQGRVALLEAALAARPAAPPEAAALPPEAAPEADDHLSEEQAALEDAVARALGSDPAPSDADAAAGEPVLPEPPIPEPPVVPKPSRGFEERIGTRWTVWVGGLALALGGIFLVRYSIEQNLLSPEIRLFLGAVFAALLAGAGEWLRRRERALSLPGIPSAHVPGILTAAGTSTAFATVFAAYALYGLIGPAVAFALLGVVSVLTMLAATLHGPALGGLGLVAALGSPFLVASDEPQPWALVPYLAFVVLAAYGVARLRLWRWLALAAATGALLWTLPIAEIGAGNQAPAMTHLVIQLWLAGVFLVVEPQRHAEGGTRIDWFAAKILLAFALGSLVVASTVVVDGSGRIVFMGIVILTLLALGLRYPAVVPALGWGALAVVGTLVSWPIRREIGADPEAFFFQTGDAFALRPEALGDYLAFALVGPAIVALGALRELARTDKPLPVAAWYAGAMALVPLLALAAAYWRVAALERDLSFGLIAGGLALAFTAVTVWLRGRETGGAVGVRLGIGAAASTALAALALGLTFVLDKGMLTVAFALSALGTAWVAGRASIPALRWAVAATGLVILGRLLWSPTIVPGDPGPPIVNWLLWGYGVPALCFAGATRILARMGRDRATQVTEGLSIVFAALLIFFQIRHALHAGDPLAETSDHLEAGLFVTTGLAFSLVLALFDSRRADPVYRYGSAIFKGLSLLLAAGALFVVNNPLLTGEPILGGVVFNSLIPAYLLPAALAVVLAALERRTKPRLQILASGALGLLLLSAYLVMEIRRIFQGADIGLWHPSSQAEQWSYSVALLLLGIVLLGVGLMRDVRAARIASAVYLVGAVLKVFIVDLANLEGVMRALSFIGLGLVLIGIGLVYQRLLIRRPTEAATP